jgi:transposase
MSRYLPYSPDQVELLPARVHEVLGSDHLCFFVHRVVERLDLGRFEEAYSAEGGMLYHPSLMLKVWLYAYALGVTSSRRVEQRIREDLAFRYLAGGSRPDYWALNAFRRRHGRAINDCFTQVVELARGLGMRQLGTVAIDATRIKASASPDKVVKIERGERARTRLKVRRWQQACDADDPNENAGSRVGAAIEAVEQVELGRDLAPLPPSWQRRAPAVGHRPGCPLPACQGRALRARLHGRDRGLGRPSHRGPAGHRAVHRQRLAGPHGEAGEDQLWLAARARGRR